MDGRIKLCNFHIFILCAGIIVIGIILCIIIKVSHMSDDEQKKDDERQLEFIRAYKEHKKGH